MSPQPIWNRSNINTANAQQQTTPEWSQARALIYMQDAADQRNATKVLEYIDQWARYRQDRDNQPAATNLPVPQPATAQVVDVMANGWPETVDGTTLVCTPNVYQPPKIIADTHGLAFAGGSTVAAVDPFVGPLGTQVHKSDGTGWMRFV